MRLAVFLIVAALANFSCAQDSSEKQIVEIERQLKWLKPTLGVSVAPLVTETRAGLQADLLNWFARSRPADKPPKTVDLPKTGGVVVLSVLPNSPAALAGLELFDVVFDLDGNKIATAADYSAAAEAMKLGEAARIKVHRPYMSAKSVQWKTKQLSAKPLALRDVLLGAYEVSRDDVKGVTFFQPPRRKGSRVQWYVSRVDGSAPVVVLQVVYVGDDFFGLDGITFKTATKAYDLERSLDDKLENFDIGYRGVAEWFHVVIDNEAMLQDLSGASGILARLNGSPRSIDLDDIADGELSTALQLRDLLSQK